MPLHSLNTTGHSSSVSRNNPLAQNPIASNSPVDEGAPIEAVTQQAEPQNPIIESLRQTVQKYYGNSEGPYRSFTAENLLFVLEASETEQQFLKHVNTIWGIQIDLGVNKINVVSQLAHIALSGTVARMQTVLPITEENIFAALDTETQNYLNNLSESPVEFVTHKMMLDNIVKVVDEQKKSIATWISTVKTKIKLTPTEALTHLIALSQETHSPSLRQFTEKAKHLFENGPIRVDTVSVLLDELLTKTNRSGTLLEYSARLEDIKRNFYSSQEGIPLTRLHDNVYGRVFEAAFIKSLVEGHPSPAVLEASHKMGLYLKDQLFANQQGIDTAENRAFSIYKYTVDKGVRPWFPKVPWLEDFVKNNDSRKKITVLKRILEKRPRNHFDVIALQYLAVQIILEVPMEWRGNAHTDYR